MGGYVCRDTLSLSHRFTGVILMFVPYPNVHLSTWGRNIWPALVGAKSPHCCLLPLLLLGSQFSLLINYLSLNKCIQTWALHDLC